jgi:hypothetical protein
VGNFFPEIRDLVAAGRCVMTGNAITPMSVMIIDNIVLECNYFGRIHCVTRKTENQNEKSDADL